VMKTVANIAILAVGLQTLVLLACCPCAAHRANVDSMAECGCCTSWCCSDGTDVSAPESCCASFAQGGEKTPCGGASSGHSAGNCRCAISPATLPAGAVPPPAPLLVADMVSPAGVGVFMAWNGSAHSTSDLGGPPLSGASAYLLHCVFLC
jgi:hypothetical protein